MADIKELAISYWRMEKWLNNTNVERKMAASSALRSIKKYLDSNGIEVVDLTGQKFDSGLAVDVINNDIPEGENEETALISEMIKPIIMQNGAVIQFGQVSIGLTVKKLIENKPMQPEKPIVSASSNNDDLSKEINKLADSIKNSPTRKTKIAFCVVAVCVALLLATNTVMMITFKNRLSDGISQNSTKINELVNTNDNGKSNGDIDSIKNDIAEIKNAIKSSESGNDSNNALDDIKSEIKNNFEKIDTLIEEFNKSADEVKLQKYTVKSGDSLYKICKSKMIDYNSNLSFIQSINGLDDPSKIYIGQILILPISNMEEE